MSGFDWTCPECAKPATSGGAMVPIDSDKKPVEITDFAPTADSWVVCVNCLCLCRVAEGCTKLRVTTAEEFLMLEADERSFLKDMQAATRGAQQARQKQKIAPDAKRALDRLKEAIGPAGYLFVETRGISQALSAMSVESLRASMTAAQFMRQEHPAHARILIAVLEIEYRERGINQPKEGESNA